jgi:hypothetical protein
MRRLVQAVFTVLALLLTSPAFAAAPTLKAELKPLGFTVGRWSGDAGKVENGVKTKGSFVLQPAVDGATLLSRGHTELFSADGRSIGAFDQLLLIYPERGDLHADYFDDGHVIHYISADIDPGKSVTFNTAKTPGMPRFRLTYTLRAPSILNIKFEMQPPGSADFQTIASGDAKRS